MAINTRAPWLVRTLRYSGIALLIWLAIALLGFLALPSTIKKLAISQTQEQIGRKLAIGDIHVNLFSLTVTADDVVLYEPDNTTPMFSAKQLMVNGAITSLLRLAPVLDEVKIVTPNLHIVRLDNKDIGVYNFSDILDKIAAMPPSEEKSSFAIANIQLENGQILFDDKVTQKSIDINTLHVGIPYISNFTSKVDSFVQPNLSATINGTPFALKGRSKPFTQSQETTLALDIDKLDLVSYLPFIPTALPVQLQSALLSTKLDIGFTQNESKPQITLSGDIILDKVALADNKKQPLLKTAHAALTLQQFDVMHLSGGITQLVLQSPEVWASLNKQGQMNWVNAFQTPAASKAPPAQTATPAPVPAAETEIAATEEPPAAPIGITLQHLVIENGKVHWTDDANASPRAQVVLSKFNVDAKALSTTPNAIPGTFTLSATENDKGTLHFIGTIDPMKANLAGKASLEAVQLSSYQNYINTALKGALSGQVNAKVDVAFQDANLTLANLGVSIADMKLAAKNTGTINAKNIALDDATVDLTTRQFHAVALRLSNINADVRRDKNGALNLDGFIPPPAKGTPAKSTAKSPDWKATLDKFAIVDSAVSYTDASMAPVQTVKASAINLNVDRLSSLLDTASKLSLQARLDKNGQLSVQGQVAPHLKKVDLTVDAKNIPVAPWQSFFNEFVNVTLARGNVSVKGTVALTPPVKQQKFALLYKGNAALSNFRVLSKSATDADFLRWKQIDVRGIEANIGQSRPVINLSNITLTNFYARAVLSDKGRLNLQDIMVTEESPAIDPKAPAASPAPSTTVANTTTSKAPVTPEQASDSAPIIRVGAIALSGGNINFTDNFVKPNYRANMTGLSGKIGAVASDKINPAEIDIRGKIDNDAPLIISGSLNPLFKPLFLDVKASAHGIELTRLTPYSSKYAGYPIEKGKLSMDVSYKIEEQKLVAQNSLRIDQLTFGDHIDGPDVTKLPVMLAVSLLKDRNGQINVDLPVSGSLSDPQFSIGGVIFRVFMNLIVKAVTSPFALIGSMFGDGEELSNVQFASGSAALTPDIKSKLDTLSKALDDRPGLKIDIIGRVDPKLDEAGLAEEKIHRQMRALKRQSLAASEKNAPNMTLTPDEEAKYLTEVYKKASFDKPRNAVGFAKSIPPEEMKSLLIANITIEKNDLQDLAMKRADAVRGYMETEGHVSLERIYLVAPKLTTEDIKDKNPATRVDFSLK